MASTASPHFVAHPHALEAGRCLLLPVPAGTVIQVLQGRLHVTPSPRWLAETVVWPVVRLEQGQAQALQQSGWVTVQALGDGEVRWLPA